MQDSVEKKSNKKVPLISQGILCSQCGSENIDLENRCCRDCGMTFEDSDVEAVLKRAYLSFVGKDPEEIPLGKLHVGEEEEL